jgi:hypothetical protein
MTDRDVEEFLAIRREAAQHIDPETAEVEWDHGMGADPYGIDRDLPEERQQVGRIYFARLPGSDIWIWVGDLPETVRLALWEKQNGGDTLVLEEVVQRLPARKAGSQPNGDQ